MRTDLVAGLLLAVLAAAVGWQYERTFQGHQHFYQQYYAPAVLEACGQGFRHVRQHEAPALDDFLALRKDSLPCAALPARLATVDPSEYQLVYRYLLGAAAMIWRVRGVSWDNLGPLFALLYGLSAGAAYGIFRLGSGRIWAVVFTILFVFAAPQLRMLPQLRDYSKAPFFLLLLLALGLMLQSRPSTRRLAVLGALAGAVVGVGTCFRRDLLICVPFVVLTVSCFLSGGPLRNLRARAVGLASFTALLLLTAWPALSTIAEGYNTAHLTILGLMRHFDEPLGIERSLYDLGHFYDDSFARDLVNSYAVRIGLHVEGLHRLPLAAGPYDRAGMSLLQTVFRAFPADAVVRAYAAAMGSLDSAFQPAGQIQTSSVLIRSLVGARHTLLAPLNVPGLGVAISAVAIVGLMGAAPRKGLFAGAAVLYFAGYPSLMFQERHFFHIQVIPYWALGVVLSQAAAAFWALYRGHWSVERWRRVGRAAARGLLLFTASILFLVLALEATRFWQQRRVSELIQRLLGAPLEVVSTTTTPLGRHRVLIGVPPPAETDDTPGVRTQYLVLALDDTACEGPLSVRYVYEAPAPVPKWTETRAIPLSREGQTRVYIPVYETGRADGRRRRFRGFKLEARQASCVVGVWRVHGLEEVPLLLNLYVPQDWERHPLYQQMGRRLLP